MLFPGIDLGTTYSLIGHVNAHGQPTLFPDIFNANEFRTPSAVYVGPEGCLVGAPAEELLEDAPALPVRRFIKAGLGDEQWRYRDHLQRDWGADGLSALVLKKLLRDAEVFSSDLLGPAVITVPAQFTDQQRRATQFAASLAGMGQVRLVEEPIAAAIYYGQEEGPVDRTLLVYDLGGGTFDVSILQVGPSGLYVLGAEGDVGIGGRHFDEAIMNLVDRDFELQFQRSALRDPTSFHRLRRLSEEAKIKLSMPGQQLFRRPTLLADQPFEFVLARAQLDQLLAPLIQRSFVACERCLSAAHLSWRDIDKVLLTGGSSLLPQVSQYLVSVIGKTTQDLILRQPHQAVAYGASILAQRWGEGSSDGGNIQCVSTASLNLRVWNAERGQTTLEKLIDRNAPLPASYTRTFYTTRDDQTRIILELVQVRAGSDEHSLGHFAFGPIRKPRRNYPLEVTVKLGADGLVHVTARDPESGTKITRLLDEHGQAQADGLEQQRTLVGSVAVNR